MGKTSAILSARDFKRKHPHGRGEDRATRSENAFQMETPPRAWGRLGDVIEAVEHDGNTPTGVGKTVRWTDVANSGQKHPHGRGEDTDR